MAEDSSTKPPEESVAAASAMRQRKKRKWDEPANFFISPGIVAPGAIPMGIGSCLGICTQGVFPISNAIVTNTIVSSITQSASTLVQKLNQPKVQDELIAREIVINDAEPTIRYKLTKRQTQEEIQRSTGAVVITRGKYRPPNALADNEKPLYLHISAGSHLKDMAERILAVDRAASMVEEILRQAHNSLSTSSGSYSAFNTTGLVNQPLSTCLFLGFEPDPSQNIAARIRGPNDQYINHIINETGATVVVLRGVGSGNHDISHAEDAQQPLHLYLSSPNSKSLEAARSLAENLLDTISAECGASRVSSSKVYSAVPPPQQLLVGVQSSANMEMSINPVVQASSLSIPNTGTYGYSIVSGGTCYSGYGGIYPQATALQQVALALKQSPASTTSYAHALPKTTSNSNADTEKRAPQKRKFQELPVPCQNSRQGSECFKPGLEDADTRKMVSSIMPPPKMKPPPPSQPGFGELPLLPPPLSPSPPPPPKFTSSTKSVVVDDVVRKQKNLKMRATTEKAIVEPVSDILLKLVEYEEEEEEEEDVAALAEESCRSNLMRSSSSSKPFWAV